MRTYIENMNERSKKIDLRKLITLAGLTGTLVAAPLMTATAEAAPPDHAPAYGYRNKDKKGKKNKDVIRDRNNDGYDDRDRDRDGDLDEDDGYDYRNTPGYGRRYGDDDNYYNDRYNNGNYNNDGRWNNGQRQTVRGTVTRRSSNNRFELRSQGTTYTVNLRNQDAGFIRVGDRVEVTGRLNNNNVLRADAVRVLTNNNGGWNGGWNGNVGRPVNFPARVISVSGNRQLTVRGDNGRTYVVRTNGNLSSSIDTGDRVRVVGNATNNNTVYATQVQLLNNNNDDDDWDNGDKIDFRGVVTSVGGFVSRVITVRAENGRTYTVRTNDDNWNRGDRVRVRGTLRSGNVVEASDVDPA